MEQSRKYMNELVKATQQHFQNVWQQKGNVSASLYWGAQGAKRLAREFGAGLADSPENEREQAIQESYQSVCVRVYGLKPPIDAKEWVYHVRGGLARGLDYPRQQ